MVAFLTQKYLIVIVSVLVVAGAFVVYFMVKKDVEYEYVVVERGNIVEEVSVTGRVKASQEVDLAFEISGRINNFYVEVGEKVVAGQRLAAVSGAELLARVNQYRAALETQQAKRDELKAGTRPEEVELQKVKVANAETSLNDAKIALVNSTKDAYVKSDDAVRNKVDQFISGPATSNPQLTFSTGNLALETTIESERKKIETMLNSWKISSDILTTSSNLSQKSSEARDNLNTTSLFLDNVALAINSAAIGVTSGNTWRADVSVARTYVATATSSLLTAESAYNTAISNLAIENSQLVIKQAGATAEQIAAQEAQVSQARARLADAQAAYSKSIINSPIEGVVTKIEAKAGEIVNPNSPVIYLISEGLQIEANLPEADIAKVKIEDTANVSLDAYGTNVIFETVVVKIDPAETIIEGIATYKITLQFMQNDERVKPGMTANIDIQTSTADNVIFLPQRAVINTSIGKYVRILDGENVIEKEVETGLRGTDGNIEIIKGLQEGERVITIIRD